MIRKEFEAIVNKYNPILSPIIKDIIESNSCYYDINEQIKWCFWSYDDLSIMGTCDRKENLIRLNINSIIKAYETNSLVDAEYFVIHEIRHIFQHIKIKEYKDGINSGVDPEIIKRWIYENDNYKTALDEFGNENIEYFMQDSEKDAYAFALAVMKHKYGEGILKKLYIPKYYSQDFYDIVNYFEETFNEESK